MTGGRGESAVTAARRDRDWPDGRTVYLTMDFECDFGTALAKNVYGAVQRVDSFVSVLEACDVPVTTFVQTEVLTEHPETVETLRGAGVDTTFHPHSHTHSRRTETDVAEEVAESTRRYRSFFGTDADGYRIPNGNVRPDDYEALAAHGYAFDASLFPSWRPNHFNNLGTPTNPHYLPDYDVLELPFTVYSDVVRVPTTLSYCQVLGRPFTELLVRRPPSTIVLNLHMHDLVTPDSYRDLSPFYRTVYGRNGDGLALLEGIVSSLQRRGYAFGLLDDAYAELAAE